MLLAASFDDLIPRLTSAIEWFGQNGLQIGRMRLGYYRKLLAEILELQTTLDPHAAAAKFPDYVNALFCASDIAAIHTAFKNGAYNELIRVKLRQSAAGPVLLQDEDGSASGNFARNIEFELVVAAHLVSGGAVLLAPDSSDVTVSLDGANVFVECKRLQSERGLEKALSKAKQQLRLACSTSEALDPIGMIAFDITKTCEMGSRPLRFANPRDVEAWTMERIQRFFQRHLALWNRIDEERIGAVIARLCVTAEVGIGETNLGYWQHYSVAHLERDSATDAIIDRVSTALRRGSGQRDGYVAYPS